MHHPVCVNVIFRRTQWRAGCQQQDTLVIRLASCCCGLFFIAARGYVRKIVSVLTMIFFFLIGCDFIKWMWGLQLLLPIILITLICEK